MAKGSKSAPPSAIWWGSNPFGMSVEVETTSEYKLWQKVRRAQIECSRHKPSAKRMDKKASRNPYKLIKCGK